MARFRIWGVAAVVVAAVLGAGYYLGDKRQIRHQLDALAATATVNGPEGDVDRLARAASIGGFFTDDVVIRRSEDNSAFVGGRRGVAEMATAAAAEHHTMKVSIDNVDIFFMNGHGADATASMTVVVSTDNPEAESVNVRQVTATLRKVNGTWLISQAVVTRDPAGG
jgi:glycine cleavage system aminomethyltransferase T